MHFLQIVDIAPILFDQLELMHEQADAEPAYQQVKYGCHNAQREVPEELQMGLSAIAHISFLITARVAISLGD